MARLNARLFARLEEERDARRRADGLRASRSRWRRCAIVLGAVRQRRVRVDALRPADSAARRVLHERHAGRHADRSAAGRHRPPVRRRAEAVAPPAGRGKAYFVERLLKEVVIGESGLAGVNRRLEMRKAALQLGAYAAMALVAVLGVIALSVSYAPQPRLPRRRSRPTSRRCARCRRSPPAASLEALLPRLDAVRAVVDSAEPISGRDAVGDALGAVSGRLGRQCRARRLPARAGRHRCCRGSRRASSSIWSSTPRSRRSSTST